MLFKQTTAPPTREAHSAKIHNVLLHNTTPNPNINTAAENFEARILRFQNTEEL